ncbi:MAG TPA: hypothetical protein VG456_10460, partial [Candidatus Sulfopaludibacter sp.]|nr:hypothetical protein [Candidatus Sulfopaludibacter sp.]
MTRIPGRAAFWLSAGILLAIPAGSQIRVGTTTGEVRLLKAQPQDDGELVGIMAVADFRRSPTISSRIHVNKEGEYRGEFKFPGLLPGFYKFVVTAKNYRAVAQEGAEVKIKSGDDDNNIDKPKPIDVVRPPQAAGGADRDAHLPLYFRLIREQDSPVPCTVPWPAAAGRTVRDGLPAPGVQVVATVWDGDAGVFQELGADVSGSDGAYSIGLDATRLEKLGSREYILAFQLKGFQPEVRSVERCQQSPAEIQLKPLPPDKRGMFSTTQEAAYRFAYPPYLMENLPVPGVRSFDYMPLLAPGVVAAPFKWTRSGAGVAPGVGTPEQFIINGLRGSENNFTVDGADDNDEELGVRRQGFVNPAPQPLESIGELQLISALADVRYGRGIAAQLNAITASGAAAFHGGVSGFFTDNAFNARDFFTGPGNDPFRRTMASGTLSGPIHKPDSFFFVSYGIIATSAQPQTQFAVPTAAQRGVNGTGETGFSALQIYPLPSFNGTGIPSTAFTPASIPGNAIFSLFPFPNNPEGAYGPNTWTTNLPADQHARQFAVKSDHRLGRAALALRYNRIDENSQLATVGDALDSTIQPRVMNQSVAAYLDVSVRPNIESSFRASFGTTAMSFADRIGRSPLPSNLFPNQPFLLNAPLLLNVNRPGAQGSGFVTASSAQGAVILNAAGVPGSPTSESITGPLGAVWIDGFSPVGVDPYRFPQDRNDRTFQVADLTTAIFGRHTLKAGYDVRFIQLRSNNQRNAAPLAVFSGIQGQSFFGPASPYTSALSMAAMGIPTQMDQTLSGAPLPPLRL